MVKQQVKDAARAYLEKKDNDTFADLYNETKDTLYFHIYEKVRNREIAEDLLQDTWMKILRSIDQLKSPDAFLSWAVTAANNTTLDYLKNQTEKKHNEALSIKPSDGEGDNSDVLLNLPDDKLMLPEEMMEDEALWELVMDKLDTLSDSQKMILYESAVNEKTDQAIASELGMNPNTVKTTRRRAIQQFNKAMAGLADSRGLKLVPVIGAAAFLYFFKNDVHAMEHASADSVWQRARSLQPSQPSQPSADYKPSAEQSSAGAKPFKTPGSSSTPDASASRTASEQASSGQASADLNASSGQENPASKEQTAVKTAKTPASEQPVSEAASDQTPSGDDKTQSLEPNASLEENSDHVLDRGKGTSDAATEQESSDAGRTPEEGAASSDDGVAEKGPSIHGDTGAVKSAAAGRSVGQGAAHAAGLIKSIAAVVVVGAAVTTGVLYNTGKLRAFPSKPASPKQEEASTLSDTDLAEDAAIAEASTEPAAKEDTAADTEVSSDNADTTVTEASAAPTEQEEDTPSTKAETAALSKVTADVDIINGALNTTQSFSPMFDVMSYAEHLNWFLYGGFNTLKERTQTTTYTDSDNVRKEHSKYTYDGPVTPTDTTYLIDETKTVQDANGKNTTTIEMEFSKPYTLDNYAPVDNYYEPIAQFFPDRVFDGKEIIQGGHVTTPLGMNGAGGQSMGQVSEYDVTYTYDDDGRLSSWTANLPTPLTMQVTYENGFPVSIKDTDGSGWNLSYDKTGRLSSASYTSEAFNREYSFSYESKGRLSSWDMTETADYMESDGNGGFVSKSGETQKTHTDFLYSDN